MTNRDLSQPVDARLEGRGVVAAGNEGGEASPGGAAAKPESERRPKGSDSRKSDGVAEFKKMEDNAEEGRE